MHLLDLLYGLSNYHVFLFYQRGAQTIVSQSQQQQHIRQPVQNGRTPLSTSVANSAMNHSQARPAFTAQTLKRSPVTSTEEPEYILPDSTMTEISLQVSSRKVNFIILRENAFLMC